MPVADRFQMLDRDDLPDLALPDEIAQHRSIFGIAHDMTDRKQHPGFLDRGYDVAAGLCRRGHGFFQQDVVLEFCTCDGGGFVHIVLRTNRNCITHFRSAAESLPGAEAVFRGDMVFYCHPVSPKIIGIGNGHDFQTFRKLFGKLRIAVTSRTRSDYS